MFSDQKSCEGDILEEEMGRESGLTYLNLRCDDTRKVSNKYISKYVKGESFPGRNNSCTGCEHKLNKSVKYKLFETRKGRKITPKMRRTIGIENLTKFSS